jgi:hypothetical protein
MSCYQYLTYPDSLLHTNFFCTCVTLHLILYTSYHIFHSTISNYHLILTNIIFFITQSINDHYKSCKCGDEEAEAAAHSTATHPTDGHER